VAERRLQVAERQLPVHGPVDPSSAPLGQSRPAPRVEVDQSRQRVEGLALQAVLDPRRRRPPDQEVDRLLLPAARQDEVAPTGPRVSNQEVSVVHHQALGHLSNN